MDNELSPNAALDAARTAMTAAGARSMPNWFPACAGVTFALAMGLVGASTLASGNGQGGVAQALSFAAIGVIVAHFAMYAVLMRGWRRGGVVPRVDGCAPPARRRRSYVIFAAACAVAVAVWALGQLGWAEIAFGVLAGFEYHYRLSGWRRPAGAVGATGTARVA